MSAAVTPSRLRSFFAIALITHGLIFAGLVVLALYGAVMPVTVADSARGGGLLTLMTTIIVLVPALPSVFALLSWWLCWRKGWVPTTGHMCLAIAASVLVTLVFSVAYFS